MRYISFHGCLPNQYPCGFPWCVTVCVTGTVTFCVTGNVTLSVTFSLPVLLKSFPDLKIIAQKVRKGNTLRGCIKGV